VTATLFSTLDAFRFVGRVAAPGALLLPACACSPPTDPAGKLRVAVPYDVVSLDPHVENSLEGFEQVANVYEPLVALDRELRVVPALAVSWHNPDPTTWVFRLREGVRFHDGSPLSAEDVVYSVRRLKEDEGLSIRSQISEVASATIEGGGVALRTPQPSARLLNDLAAVLIVRAGATRESLEAHPNGTGPYAVEEWTARERLRLRRHEGYWGPRPRFGQVEVEMGTDEHATPALLAGRLSILRATYPSEERAAAQGSRYRVVRQPSPYLFHLGLNVSSPTLPGGGALPNPFRRLEVRQAVDLALDRARIAAAASPYAVPTARIIPKTIFGSDPEREARGETRDLAAARRLLEAAGYPDGFDAALHGIGLKARTALPELRAQLAEVGIRVTFVDIPSAAAFQGALRRRELGLWVVGDAALTGEAGWLLTTQFHSAQSATYLGTDNYGGYANAEVDQAIEEANATLKQRERLPLLQKAVRLVEEQRWWIPLYHNQAPFIVDRSLAFEPRADLYLRYAEIGGTPP
jgi:peptide/nickel transport system substrate-binding protein